MNNEQNEKVVKEEVAVVTEGVEVENSTQTPEVVEEKPKKLKWHEEENAYPYQEGDVVQIISGRDLLLRKAVVVKPSAKKNALKAQLLHPVTNEPQKTQCSFDFDRLLLIESNGQQVNEPLTELATNESVTAV